MQTQDMPRRGFTVLLDLNWDRLYMVGTLVVALLTGAYVGTLF